MCKEQKYEVSVIILTYNPSWEKIEHTINSVIKQISCKFEIIISDDGSELDCFENIIKFFSEKNFTDYQLIKNKVNVGTVKNLIGALNKCRSEYVKDIGQGDILYDRDVLSKAYKFCRGGDYALIYGKPVSFYESHFPEEHYADNRININKTDADLLTNCFLYDVSPHGATLFFKKNIMIEYLKKIEQFVKYSEDLSVRLMILDQLKIQFFPHFITFYECDTGISNKKESMSKIDKDTVRFYDYIENNNHYINAINIKNIKKIIELRKKKLKSYSSMKKNILRIEIGILNYRVLLEKIRCKFRKNKNENIQKEFFIECCKEW